MCEVLLFEHFSGSVLIKLKHKGMVYFKATVLLIILREDEGCLYRTKGFNIGELTKETDTEEHMQHAAFDRVFLSLFTIVCCTSNLSFRNN